MTADIVTRLRTECEAWDCKNIDEPCLTSEAADEIERLKELVRFHRGQLQQIRNAIYDEGINPEYHKYVMRKQRKEWPTLWKAIDEAMKDLAQKPSRFR